MSWYRPFGAGCSGSLPTARMLPLDTPRLGATVRVRVVDLPLGIAFLMTGFSNSMGTTGPLPSSLAGIGMPGCFAYVRNDIVGVIAGPGTTAEFALTVPNDLGLVGLAFYQQAFVPDPGQNALGAVNSDAIEAVVGH